DGAIGAMRLAAETGAPSGENTAWSRVQLGHLYLNYGGDPAAAEAEYRRALAAYPGYVHAIAGLARVRVARGDYPAAIDLYARAVGALPSPEYIIALGAWYRAAGRPEAADQQYALVRAVQQLYRANGVDMDLEMVLFDADHESDLAPTLARARALAEQRPSIKVADALAWTLYKT